jgi:hypothetical protein
MAAITSGQCGRLVLVSAVGIGLIGVQMSVRLQRSAGEFRQSAGRLCQVRIFLIADFQIESASTIVFEADDPYIRLYLGTATAATPA